MAETLRDQMEERYNIWLGGVSHVGSDVEEGDVRQVIRDCVFEFRKPRLDGPPYQIQEIVLRTDTTGTDGPELAKSIISSGDLVKDMSSDHCSKSELFTITPHSHFANLSDEEGAEFE